MIRPVHMIEYFIGGTGKTACGNWSNNLTAYWEGVTCKRCLATHKTPTGRTPTSPNLQNVPAPTGERGKKIREQIVQKLRGSK